MLILQHTYIDFDIKFRNHSFSYTLGVYLYPGRPPAQKKINKHEHYINNKQNKNFALTMSISIPEDRRHTCIKLGTDIIRI